MGNILDRINDNEEHDLSKVEVINGLDVGKYKTKKAESKSIQVRIRKDVINKVKTFIDEKELNVSYGVLLMI